MSMRYVSAVWEDELSGEVVKKIIRGLDLKVEINPVFSRTTGKPSGIGYIKKNWNSFYKSSLNNPFIILADSDSFICGPSLKKDWRVPYSSPNFLFQVAVREVESWILADTVSFLSYFKIPAQLKTKFPSDIDSIADPKGFLINIVRYTKDAGYKRLMIPADGSTAKVG